MDILRGMTLVNLAVNLPGPAAARRLGQMGASVIKVEPAAGDPMAQYCPAWYRELAAGQEIVRLDLHAGADLALLDEMLSRADLLLTSCRPATLAAHGLTWSRLHGAFPRLCQVAIVGYPPPRENQAGHDLTYQASLGLLEPPRLPRLLLADMAGAREAASAALGLLLARERHGESGLAFVALSEAASALAEPLRFGLTDPGALLGGALAEYNIYETLDGWVAVAALEAHFKQRLKDELGDELGDALGEGVTTVTQYRAVFRKKTAAAWQRFGEVHDIPIVAVTAR